MIKNYVPRKRESNYCQYLDRILALEELEKTLFSMAPNKSPSSDGFSMEFYQVMWQHIKDIFYCLYLEAFRTGSLGPIVVGGLIKLLPKGKQDATVLAWHLITLLNTSCKIIAKSLATQIKSTVEGIVRA